MMNDKKEAAGAQRLMSEWESKLSRFSFAQFLIGLILLLVTSPLIQGRPYGNLIETVLMTGVMLSAILAVGGRKKSLVIAVLLVLPAFVSRWAAHFFSGKFPHEIFYMATILFVGFVIIRLFRVILLIPKVNLQILCAGVSAYLTMGIFWGLVYALLELVSPGSFTFTVGPQTAKLMSGYNGIYFSFTTLATIGYGDIVPLTATSRTLVVIEAVSGLFYMTLLIARLVAIHATSEEKRQKADCQCSCHLR